MPQYNTKFDLNLEDMDLIETALRTTAKVADDVSVDPRALHDLLGRLHNQKTFFRPSKGVYVSG
ncbi:MAG: hypothetical protein HKN63_01950 [Rhodobacteraceae bacterium]|nr:hypothetical protein [Paracoccaceae bacterium]